jgi:hypothetical protein
MANVIGRAVGILPVHVGKESCMGMRGAFSSGESDRRSRRNLKICSGNRAGREKIVRRSVFLNDDDNVRKLHLGGTGYGE